MSDQKAILITGAASGIGLATARAFAGRDWLVGALDRDAAGLARLAGELDHGGWTRALDVSDRDALAAGVTAFGEASGGRLDLLHANAGIDAKGPFATMPWERVRAVVEVNLLAVMSLVQLGTPLLAATPGSLLLATASASAIFGQAGMAAYSATKHAVRGLIEALSVELASAGVRAATLIPGIIDTGMLSAADKARLPADGPFRVVASEAVADAVWAAYEGTRLHYYIPPELHALDVAATQAPERARDERLAR